MCNLKNFYFGYADAETEYEQSPELFDKAFIDPNENLDELLHGIKSIVIGRKGTGKTAYSAKIRRCAENNPDSYVAKSCMLSGMEYSIFDEYCETEVFGGRRYASAWKFLILVEVVKMILDKCKSIENEYFLLLVEQMQKADILSEDGITYTVTSLKSSEISAKLSIFQANCKSEFTSKIRTISAINDYIIKVLKTLHFNQQRWYLLLDGLDDALRGKHFTSEITAGLVRTIAELNSSFRSSTYDLKLILFIRSDILNECFDPDLTKLKRDYSVSLSWNKNQLEEIVLNRVNQDKNLYRSFEEFWNAFFPTEFRYKDSVTAIFEYTLLRPRDILQFLIECQKNSNSNRKLFSFLELNEICARYSEEYFLPEMRDELAGFYDDDIISQLPTVLSRMGNAKFSAETFSETIKEISAFNKVDAHKLLEYLFMGGYLGQIKKTSRDAKKSFVAFKHINTQQRYDPNNECLIHRGLRKALNI